MSLHYPAIDPAPLIDHTDATAHMLRQALLPLALEATRREERFDASHPHAHLVLQSVRRVEALTAAVSAYHAAALEERRLADHNTRRLQAAFNHACGPDSQAGPDWQAITYRLFARFPNYRHPVPALVDRIRSGASFQSAAARAGWPPERKRVTAAITSASLAPPAQ